MARYNMTRDDTKAMINRLFALHRTNDAIKRLTAKHTRLANSIADNIYNLGEANKKDRREIDNLVSRVRMTPAYELSVTGIIDFLFEEEMRTGEEND